MRCLNIKEVDVDVLKVIAKYRHVTMDEIVYRTGYSYATVSKALQRLYSMGLVSRETLRHGRPGRPFRVYFVDSQEMLAEGIRRLAERCAEQARREAEEVIKHVLGGEQA